MVRVVALSGGSFSRALSEGLNVKQSEAEFNQMLDESIQSIFEASKT